MSWPNRLSARSARLAIRRAAGAVGWLGQAFPQFEPTLVTDLHGRWESYEVFTAPINWRFESGDRVEFNVVPEGERLDAPFDLGGVVIPPAAYQWLRYRLEAGSALKRQ